MVILFLGTLNRYVSKSKDLTQNDHQGGSENLSGLGLGKTGLQGYTKFSELHIPCFAHGDFVKSVALLKSTFLAS